MADQERAGAGGPAGTPQGPAEQGQAGAPLGDGRFVMNTHYVKDLSFENPNAPGIFGELRQEPHIAVRIDVAADRVQDRTFEVRLDVEVNATAAGKTAFLVELQFAGIVTINPAVPEDAFESLLFIDAPRYLFPFARNIVSEVTRDGGYPPLLISPFDFAQLRQQRPAAGESTAAAAKA